MPERTEYRAGKGSDLTVRLVNPDTQRWQIERTHPRSAGLEAALREACARKGRPVPPRETKVYEVADWQLDDMVSLNLHPRFAQARSLMTRIRRDWPATGA
jgi:hypothetical protein